jgi:hypothetical protein
MQDRRCVTNVTFMLRQLLLRGSWGTMSRKWRERVGAVLGCTILIAVMVIGLVLGFGLLLTLPIAVIAAAAAHLAIVVSGE